MIQEWQRTACRDTHYRKAAARIQCAVSCKTAEVQPVPSAPPSLKGISICGDNNTQLSHINYTSVTSKIYQHMVYL